MQTQNNELKLWYLAIRTSTGENIDYWLLNRLQAKLRKTILYTLLQQELEIQIK